jgi:DNA (cytosine-5)-methyltransferase 1
MKGPLSSWYLDPKIQGVTLHESRSHMETDLYRYLYAASFTSVKKKSPKLRDFPRTLLPSHENVDNESIPFEDRFRVQLHHEPSSTIVSHIAKDGHYYIHYDPSQCRSLTVREAARLQTFPDNYFFDGGIVQGRVQTGNAVPPLLAQAVALSIKKYI